MDARTQTEWPAEGLSRVPYWIYSDQDIYQRELQRIFYGPSWNYVALEIEIPKAGDYVRTFVGEKSVVVTRDRDGGVNVVENRCAHRGTQICQTHLGNTKGFMCPYHQWTYDLKGNLLGIPLSKGVNKQGGMPAGFDLKQHGLNKLRVARRNGVIFASLSDDAPSLEGYMGPTMLQLFDRVFDGRGIHVLGYSRQLIPANWKLMFENIRDPYHASLLHVFLVSFGLYRLDTPNRLVIDGDGRMTGGMTWRGEQKRTEANAEMRSLHEDLVLNDPQMLQPVKEYENYTLCMMTWWPNLIIQQQSNTLAIRQIVPKGTDAFELAWTFFGYDTDDAEMTKRRLRQANLMGPSGYVSMDDSEVLSFEMQGVRAAPEAIGVLEMNGGSWEEELDHGVTESQIRAFYHHYRRIMDL